MIEPAERALATAIGSLTYENPFLPGRIECERAVLGDAFVPERRVWSRDLRVASSPNLMAIAERARALAERWREVWRPLTPADRTLYSDLVTYVLYDRYSEPLVELAERDSDGKVGFYDAFAADAAYFLGPAGLLPSPRELAHLFACFYQVRRAFLHIFTHIVGTSLPAARLRADTWCSTFSRDLRRYQRSLYERMGDVTTLILGPTGTGKELVARAIAFSRYIPFDDRTSRFAAVSSSLFSGLNLSAMSPALIEAELFGHRKGAFTGALSDRKGWLEECSPSGTVFLDEVGDLDPAIQVKLLRVLQTRTFQRLGETTTRHFAGKIIAATNRDPAAAIASGALRRDFYYRLCADVITTPSLSEQLDGPGDELRHLVLHVAARVAGEDEAAALAEDALRVIEKRLGARYSWPGNFRELEQCMRGVMVHGDYVPVAEAPPSEQAAVLEGRLTEEELLRWYTTLVYKQTGSYQEVARRLGIDRRTVAGRVKGDPEE
jgi:transcriptional regulator with AAA-type ATPase domain